MMSKKKILRTKNPLLMLMSKKIKLMTLREKLMKSLSLKEPPTS